MEVLKERYTITELSERLNITDHALRYYEKEFNLNIPKDERGRRFYTPELANIMYQVKTMRDEGLEIKAIRKILTSESMVTEPPPVVVETEEKALVATKREITEVKKLFDELGEQLAGCISTEVGSAREHLSRELQRTKLELGACVENSVRKLEAKMEKHFVEVDRSLSGWREKNRRGSVKRFLSKVFK